MNQVFGVPALPFATYKGNHKKDAARFSLLRSSAPESPVLPGLFPDLTNRESSKRLNVSSVIFRWSWLSLGGHCVGHHAVFKPSKVSLSVCSTLIFGAF